MAKAVDISPSPVRRICQKPTLTPPRWPEALVLAEHAGRVTIFHRGPVLRAQQALIERASGKIAIALDTLVEEILGDDAIYGGKIR